MLLNFLFKLAIDIRVWRLFLCLYVARRKYLPNQNPFSSIKCSLCLFFVFNLLISVCCKLSPSWLPWIQIVCVLEPFG